MTPETSRAAWQIDTSCWPLVRCRPTGFVDDPAALDLAYEHMTEVLRRGQPFVCVFDIRRYDSSSARRKRFGAWVETHERPIRAHCVAVAAVAQTAIEVGVMTAYSWLVKPMVPLKVATTVAEAEAWLLARFDEHAATRPT